MWAWIRRSVIALLICLPVVAIGAPVLWPSLAMRFTGESEKVRQDSITRLREMPDLKGKLLKALGTTDHFLALDVITALQMRELVPELLVFAERDRTGYVYHALNTLIRPKDEEKIAALYIARLDSGKALPAAKIAILDALARIGTNIGSERIAKFLKDDSPEVRSSALGIVRMELVRRGLQRNLPALDISIGDTIFQMRLQTLYLISELPKSVRLANLSFIHGVLDQCLKDPAESVRTLCTKLRESEK